MTERVGVVGLGRMGLAIATTLQRAAWPSSASISPPPCGSEADLARAAPMFAALAEIVVDGGPTGVGTVAKLVDYLLCAAHLLTNGEAMRLAEAGGVPAARVLEAVNAASEVNPPR